MLRWPQAVVALAASTALVVGAGPYSGLRYVVFASAIILGAGVVSYWVYVRATQRWLLESFRLLGEGRLAEVEPRVEQELQRPSGLKRAVLLQLRAELSFWKGDFEVAYQRSREIDMEQMPPLWRGVGYSLRVLTAVFSGHLTEASQVLERHRTDLEEEPGLHHLEALVAMRSGSAELAQKHWTSVAHQELPRPRPPLYRAALALFEAEIRQALGQDVSTLLATARELGGESFVKDAASARLDSISSRASSAAP